MSNELRSNAILPQAEAQRPCAFYNAVMCSVQHTPRAVGLDSSEPAHGLKHRCILNPGRDYGPDGQVIGPQDCTMARQCVCQVHRRSNIARLHATASPAIL